MIGRFQKYYRASTKLPSILKWCTIIQLARLIAVFRSTSQMVVSWPDGPIMLSPKVVIFMHFNRAGRVSAAIFKYINDLAANGRSVVFVTNSGFLIPESFAELKKICAAVYVRRNLGYDFGAWRDVIDTLRLPGTNTEELIIINDSMYGPFISLEAMIARLDYNKADIWGLVDSWQERYHLQSFFLAFGQKALRSSAFKNFWRGVRPVPAKTYIVRKYEVGFTQTMLKAGLRCSALWPYDNLVKMVDHQEFQKIFDIEDAGAAREDPIFAIRKLQMLRIRQAVARRIALNPTADLWRQLLLSGFPFIKRELLRENPTEVEDVADWVEVVRTIPGASPEATIDELRIALKNRAP